MLHLVHLSEKRRDLVKTFSGGMKRRLALARALLHQPRVLYLDEPSLGVDVQNRNALYGFIRRLPEQGVTVLLTTNDMHEAEQLCTRVAIIDKGRPQVVDTPLNLVRQARGAETRIDLVVDTPEGNEDLALALGQLPGITGVVHEQNRFTVTTDGGQQCLGDILREIVQQGRTVLDIAVREAELEAVFLRVTGQLLRD
jgi:ABC-2 type transport system ATP-binding protein